MKVGMLLEYKTIDKEEIKVELDVFKTKSQTMGVSLQWKNCSQ
jgi:hypothetical protein